MDHKGTQILETERLVLRPFRTEDAPAMFRNWASDEEVTRFLTWPAHRTEADSAAILREWTADYARKDFYQWAIVPKGNGPEPVGSISVVSLSEQTEKAHIGYCIGRQWWHQGITSEAMRAVMDFLFDEVGVQRVDSRHDPRNPHSGAVMEKCGMRYEGTLRQSDWNNQGICDACWYALLLAERQAKESR